MLLYLKRSEVDARLEVNNNKYFLKSGSKIRVKNQPNFERQRKNWYEKWQEIVKNKVNSEGLLSEDVEVSSITEATTMVLGGNSPDNKIWKTDKGIPYVFTLNSDVTLDSEHDQEKYLIELLKDIDSLVDIESESEFNIFETLSIVRAEIRHSNVLAWLLNPNETHGLNSYFLKKFIQSVYVDNEEIYKHLNYEEVFLWEYPDVYVYRENMSIDILIVDESKQFVLVIENKIDSSEHNDQLVKYRQFIDNKYSNYRKMYVFLTKKGEESSDSKIWGSYSYEKILLDGLLEDCIKKTNNKVKDFLIDYHLILRRDIVGDERLEKMCRQIYNKHKKALDLIYEYKPDIVMEITSYLKEKINNIRGIEKNHSVKMITRFTDNKLREINKMYEGLSKNWVTDGSVILYELKIVYDQKNDEYKLNLSTVVGPTIDNSRDEIINFYINDGHKVHAKGDKWTTLKTVGILSSKSNHEIESIKEKIDNELEKIIKNHINDINNIFKDFKRKSSS